MAKRQKILIGMAAGAVWGLVLIWIGSTQINIPPFSRALVQPFLFLAPGLILLAMIAALAARRFFDADLIDGQSPPPGCRADIDQRVLKNTLEQAVLAICLWTPITFLLPSTGLSITVCLSVNFLFARILFWVGYHISPPLRAFGFAATFYPTVLTLLWAIIWWLRP